MDSGGTVQEWTFVIGYLSFALFVAWGVFASSTKN